MSTYTPTAYKPPTYTSGRKGPIEAVSSSLATIYRQRWLAIYFAQRDFSRNYRSSHLGFLWALLNPLLMIILFMVVFSYIRPFREVTGDSALNFGLYLYCGLLPFLAFSETLSKSVSSIRNNSALIQKVVFPVEILPLTRTITIQVDKLFGLGMLIIVVAIWAQRVEWTILLLPLLIAIQLVFLLGLSYLFAVIGTYMPDVKGFLRAFVRGVFFATPIIWPESLLPESLRFLVDYNPLAVLVRAHRNLILEGQLPDLSSVLWFSVFAAALCLVGFAIFVRVKHEFADLL